MTCKINVLQLIKYENKINKYMIYIAPHLHKVKKKINRLMSKYFVDYEYIEYESVINEFKLRMNEFFC